MLTCYTQEHDYNLNNTGLQKHRLHMSATDSVRVTSGEEKVKGRGALQVTTATGGTSNVTATTNTSHLPLTRSSTRLAEIDKDVKLSKSEDQNTVAPLPPVTTQEVSKPEGCHVVTRSSGRLVKRPRRDSTPPSSPVKKVVKEEKKDCDTPERKQRRWELWSLQDKKIFFEGLCEHGKDFDAILNLFNHKHKRRPDVEGPTKTKDQIRHFYYRTWNKIAKHVECWEGVNKHSLELYGLINYGELRKRVGGKLDEKIGQKLNELVYEGFTVVKVKGKNHRLRTPLCRALKKLNHVEVKEDENKVRVPEFVTIELYPHTNLAWSHVQSLAQNPRVRVKLKSNRKVSDIIDFLDKKWKPERLRMKDELEVPETPSQELILHIPDNYKLCAVDMTPAPAQPKLELGLRIYHEKMCALGPYHISPHGRKKEPIIDTKVDDTEHDFSFSSLREDMDISETKENSTSLCSNNCAVEEEAASSECPGKGTIGGLSKDNADSKEAIVSTNVDITQQTKKDSVVQNIPFNRQNSENHAASVSTEPHKQRHKGEDILKKIHGGLVAANACKLSVAELYLMAGSPDHLCLRYAWIDKVKPPDVVQLNIKLTNMLRRLVHLATNEFSDFRVKKIETESPPKCSCGRIQETSTPSNKAGQKKQNKSPGSSRGSSIALNTHKGTQTDSSCRPTVDTNKSITPNKDDGVFPLPTVPIRPKIPDRIDILNTMSIHQKHQEMFLPRRRRNLRTMRKPMVVQRTLLPKAPLPSVTVLPAQSQIGPDGAFLAAIPVQTNKLQTNQAFTTKIVKNEMPTRGPVRKVEHQFGGPMHRLAGTSSGTTTTMSPADILKKAIDAANIPTDSEPEHDSPERKDSDQKSAVSRERLQGSILSLSENDSAVLAGPDCPLPSLVKNAIVGEDTFLGVRPQIPKLTSISTKGLAHMRNGQTSVIGDLSMSDIKSNESMTNLSSLLDFSLPPVDVDSSDKLMEAGQINQEEMTLRSSSLSFAGMLEKGASGHNSPPRSPTKNSAGPELQWLGGEDFNLSSFLHNSPAKKPGNAPPISQMTTSQQSSNTVAISQLIVPTQSTASMLNDSSRDSILGKMDVDKTVASVLNENSMDYAVKFADLAEQITEPSQDGSRRKLGS